jgi:zinc transport system ATP-binding protein
MEDLTGTLGLSGLKENRINELSGGQLQKVLIGRALISEPEILVLDEPTSNLDINTRKDIYRILSDLKGKKTVIIVIHEIEELLSYLDSIIYVNKTVDYFKNDKSLIDSDTRKICRHSIMHALEQRIYNKCLSETGGSKDAGCSS